MLGALLTVLILPAAVAQMQNNPSSASDPIYGSVTTAQPVAGALPLSLDDAIRRGLAHNLQMAIATQDQRTAAGERLEAINYLMPTITWQAERSRNQFNLAAARAGRQPPDSGVSAEGSYGLT